jgi:hypothetical protein
MHVYNWCNVSAVEHRAGFCIHVCISEPSTLLTTTAVSARYFDQDWVRLLVRIVLYKILANHTICRHISYHISTAIRTP